MRADRLISILMILQARGRVTAEELASELEVSVRTIYRDITALSTAGVPIYCERGPGGGIALVERYRTDLTGLSKQEARALFMLSIPAPLDELGMGEELKAAMLKLAAALPSSRREDERISRQRIHLDWTPWFHEQEPEPHLHNIKQAVWDNHKLYLEYLTEAGEWLGTIELIVAPYGLVAKSGQWYLVAEGNHGNMVVIRTSWVIQARRLKEKYQPPEDFDLAKFWYAWQYDYENQKPYYPVLVRVPTAVLQALPTLLGKKIQSNIDTTCIPDHQGWSSLTLPFESLEDARDRLLVLGGAVEVLEPLALRLNIIDYAQQILAVYEEQVLDK